MPTRLDNNRKEVSKVAVSPVSELARSLCKMFEQLKSTRSNWETTWSEVADYVLPNKSDVFTSMNRKTKGDERHDHLYDGSAEHFNELLASALHSMLTNPTAQWFSLTTGDEDIDSQPEVKAYIQKLVRLIHEILNNTNFQTEIHEVYIDLGSFGTSSLLVLEDDEDIVRFVSRPIYELYVQEDAKGQIDTVMTMESITVRNAFQKFGREVFGDHALELEKTMQKEIEVLHIILPRGDVPSEKKGPKAMPIASYHIWKDKEIILRESGFEEIPYIITRWMKMSGETYGRSPAMKSLPDVRMLNSMMKTTIRAAQKMVDPPLMIPDDGIMGRINTVPGGLNSYRAGTQDRIFPLEIRGNIGIGLEMMENARNRVKEAFFIDQLQLREGPQMTATEVNQRVEEHLRLLGPILGRQHFELLQPLVTRLLSILGRKKLLPDNIPAVLGTEEGRLKVFFSSQIAKAQRISEATNIQRFLEASVPAIQLQPTASDILDSEAIIKIFADRFGVDTRIFNSEKKIEQVREDRVNQEQAEAEQQQTLNNAEVVNKTEGE